MKIKKIAIFGSGLMGMGISNSIAINDFQVSIFSKSDNCKERFFKYIDTEADKKRMDLDSAEIIKNNVSVYSYDGAESLKEADLIIESTYEDKKYKQEVVEFISKYSREEAIIASNTSTLSISELAASYKNQKNFLGLHFFSPVPQMKLVEVVKGYLTDDKAINDAIKFIEEINKEAVIVKDTAGFVLNRIIAPYISEAVCIYEKKLTSAENIDKMVSHCLGAKVGPLQLGDYIGIDVLKKCTDNLFDAYKDPHYCNTLINNMYYANNLGKKTGKGFYEYG